MRFVMCLAMLFLAAAVEVAVPTPAAATDSPKRSDASGVCVDRHAHAVLAFSVKNETWDRGNLTGLGDLTAEWFAVAATSGEPISPQEASEMGDSLLRESLHAGIRVDQTREIGNLFFVYDRPGDIGAAAFVDSRNGQVVFAGGMMDTLEDTVIVPGEDGRGTAERILFEDSGDAAPSEAIILESDYFRGSWADEGERVWQLARRTNLVRSFAQCGEYEAVVWLHTPTIEPVVPGTALAIVIVTGRTTDAMLALGDAGQRIYMLEDLLTPGKIGADEFSRFGIGEKLAEGRFDRHEVGDRIVCLHRRTLDAARVEGDVLIYEFDRETGVLVSKETHWRDDLPESLPTDMLTGKDAWTVVGSHSELLAGTGLYLLSPASAILPNVPTPRNPCWVLVHDDSLEEGYRREVAIIDAVTGDSLGEGVPPSDHMRSLSHAADQDRDIRVSLSEMLRVVQLYTVGGYRCASGTEDGYEPTESLTVTSGCWPHASDYSPHDWRISLGELLRLIQLYNSPGYHVDPSSEDGFAPGSG